MRLLVALLFLPLQAQALPIVYDIAFDAAVSNSVGDGVGSFNWDDEALTISNFTWDFGDGRTGGFLESFWPSEFDAGPGTWSILMFELITGEDVAPWDCTEHSHSCDPPFDEMSIYGWPASSGGYIAEFVGGPPGVVRSLLTRSNPEGAEGWLYTATRRESVPEPATLSLLGTGLGALLWRRRRRTN